MQGKMYWVGPFKTSDIEEMTREELLEVTRYMAKQLEFYQRPGMARALALGSVQMLRNGERA